MKKIRKGFFLCLILLLLVGCSTSQKTTTPKQSNDEAAQIIISDLKHHGIFAQQIMIDAITHAKDGKEAVVQYTLIKGDSTTQALKVELSFGPSGWQMGHEH